jgi:hypothetical protein
MAYDTQSSTRYIIALSRQLASSLAAREVDAQARETLRDPL